MAFLGSKKTKNSPLFSLPLIFRSVHFRLFMFLFLFATISCVCQCTRDSQPFAFFLFLSKFSFAGIKVKSMGHRLCAIFRFVSFFHFFSFSVEKCNHLKHTLQAQPFVMPYEATYYKHLGTSIEQIISATFRSCIFDYIVVSIALHRKRAASFHFGCSAEKHNTRKPIENCKIRFHRSKRKKNKRFRNKC